MRFSLILIMSSLQIETRFLVVEWGPFKKKPVPFECILHKKNHLKFVLEAWN